MIYMQRYGEKAFLVAVLTVFVSLSLFPVPVCADWFQDVQRNTRVALGMAGKQVNHSRSGKALIRRSKQGVGTSRFDSIIEEAGACYGVHPNFIRAVIKCESNFNPAALSHKNAMGLMQLTPITVKHLAVKNPWDPRENVFAGTRYLRDLLDEFQDTLVALAAYHSGPTRIRNGGVIYKSSRKYASDIFYEFRRLQAASREVER